ncbi:ORF5 [Fowl aviadenovirus 1]|uniref:Uncharacterized protein ORF5 n=2 Tax=Fowl aviadenovirus A TaxID=190061 RepID=YO5_ADEG1|nr:hypothetical protein FAdVAgp21 [Fowl aviadenovirus A]Q64766.1 RecName: Full=Uncharacterized protein ORF5 [Fowl aviadenovirus 1]AAC54922.1 ORF5 [Fowl aviadenovirus 1]QGQ63313.1 ORF5 [Fowl aviadenovirus A]
MRLPVLPVHMKYPLFDVSVGQPTVTGEVTQSLRHDRPQFRRHHHAEHASQADGLGHGAAARNSFHHDGGRHGHATRIHENNRRPHKRNRRRHLRKGHLKAHRAESHLYGYLLRNQKACGEKLKICLPASKHPRFQVVLHPRCNKKQPT